LLEGAELIGRIVAFVEKCERTLPKARSFACRPEKAAQKQKKNPGGYTAGIFRF
jgi:hypothetical protein